MSSRHSTDSSDIATLYDETVSKEEVRIVVEFVNTSPKKWKPSSDQVVIGVVHPENRRLLSDKLDRKYSGLFDYFRCKSITASTFPASIFYISGLSTFYSQSSGMLLR
jgi:hypothetical protein